MVYDWDSQKNKMAETFEEKKYYDGGRPRENRIGLGTCLAYH